MGIKSVLARPFIVALLYVLTLVTLIYILSIWKQESSLFQVVPLLGMAQESVKMHR